MVATVAKRFTFDAAHQLPNHDGKCAQPHGHTYTVEVAVSGEINPIDGQSDEGMVIDFGVLTLIWRGLEPLLDHRDLNESLAEEVHPTTAENIAGWICTRFAWALAPSGTRVQWVRVWETPSCYAEVRPDQQPTPDLPGGHSMQVPAGGHSM